jgi:hypothetical protein
MKKTFAPGLNLMETGSTSGALRCLAVMSPRPEVQYEKATQVKKGIV